MVKVLVTGANGRTGRAIVQALARAGSPRVPVVVRAFLRNPAQWPTVAALGASEHAIGDMADGDAVARALEGCDALVHVGPPMHPDEKAMTANFIAAARRQKLRHFVYYSVLQPLRREVRHHRLKLETEELVVESDLPYTIVQPTRYMQHLDNIWQAVTTQGVHGMPFSTRVQFNVADLADLAEATARVVVESAPGAVRPGAHLFATYELAGPEALSQDDMARTLADVLGRPVVARAVPLEEMRAKARTAGLGDDRIEQMTVMNHHYDLHGMRGNPNVLRMLLGREPTTYRQYVERLARR